MDAKGRITNRAAPAAAPPEPAQLSAGWRVAAVVWLLAFGGLFGLELVVFLWKALRGMF